MFSKFSFLPLVLFLLLFISAAEAATFVVDRNDDVAGAGACTAAANDCSLRGAINNANANGAGPDTINFNVGGGNAQSITAAQQLPVIQTSLVIDGSTQPLWGGPPLIEINGLNAGVGAHGFFVAGGGNPVSVIIKSLVINRFGGSGIFFNATGESSLTVTGCYIGTSANGISDFGNGGDGIRINAVWDSTYNIGGTQTGERNVISGNGGDGININATFNGFESADTQAVIINNFIGTTAAGNADLGNSESGVSFAGAGFGYTLLVGGALTSQRNIVSGNDEYGVFANSNNISIIGNYIGTSLNGNADLGNTLDGVRLEAEVDATVGASILGFNGGNVISGNNANGISINDAGVKATIKRNRIGTNAAGTSGLGNSEDGINLYEQTTFTNVTLSIGSETEAADGNTISGNGGDGISIGENIRQVKIFGNRIGTNETATAAVPNGVAGIRVQSSQNQIGLDGNDIASNVISGNTHDGILIAGSLANGNFIYNNFIGTNASGANLGNGSNGIYINQSALGNHVGNGSESGTNRIAFNDGDGVTVADGSINAIRANSIYSNAELGIDLEGDGVTNNDAGDNDSGANDEQNFPVIQRATPTRITGVLNSSSEFEYEMDFYRVDSCDASNHGEGRYHLGTMVDVFTDASGNASFDFQTALSVGQFVTATATFPNAGAGDTSEFSQCVAVTAEPGNLSFSAAAYTVNEASATRTIVVNRNGGNFGTITVDYATSNGTASAGQDYTTKSGTLTFLNGEVVKSFDIPITGDGTDETDETVNLTLSNASPGVFLAPNQAAVLTILDNDAPPSISIEDVSHEEGNVGANQFSFRVSLSGASSFPVSVDFITADGTATFNSDYLPTNGQVNFAPGETLKNILVTINGDLTTELNETFFVNLSNPSNAALAENQALGTILDDDNPGKFQFSFAPYSGAEHQQATVTVARTGGDAGTVSVDYMTSGGTATPVTDYTPLAGTLIFGDGETVKTFNVSLADDNAPEPSETVNLVLSNPIGGAVLGVPAIAALNILDDDSGTLYTIGGEVKKSDNTPLAGATVNLNGAQTATTTTDADGRFSFPNLAPNGNYSVTPAAFGFTFNPLNRQYSNLSGNVENANFTATAAPSRQLRIIGGNAAPGQNINVVVELVAQGDENSAGFSLNFDSGVLSNPQTVLGAGALSAMLIVNDSQAGNGKLGILLALPAGQSFSAGTKQLLTITFNTAATNIFSSPVAFGNIPIVKQVVNTNADPLPTNYLDGAVTFAQGFEADVTPRPTGKNNGSLTVTDFTQVGRFVAGLDSVNPLYNEFQRADCAPRVSLGNGALDVADFTQAGRYAAAVDAISPAGGQNIQSLAPIMPEKNFKADSVIVPTVVRVVNIDTSPGQQVFVTVATDAQGTENGFGFTLNYDSTKLSNPLVTKGTDTQTATLIPNAAQAGKVGVVLAMPFNEAIQAGARHLVTIRFNVAVNASGGQTPLSFGDAPVIRAVSDVNANTLTSTFQDGAVNILAPTAASVSVSGRVQETNGRGISKARVSITDQNGAERVALTNQFGYYRFEAVASGAAYVVNAVHKNHQFTSQFITVLEETDEVNFTAQASP
ncbi:MAG TPA: Calx-beta domain-containing protein [Pyrinomonadaceae bacterium]|jgi:hypothetical protein